MEAAARTVCHVAVVQDHLSRKVTLRKRSPSVLLPRWLDPRRADSDSDASKTLKSVGREEESCRQMLFGVVNAYSVSVCAKQRVKQANKRMFSRILVSITERCMQAASASRR
uniref:Uncharacterized protein n=1 Tax=Syphacia muris TaxID=451379 RepID=A0A0N5ACG5_9BILA